MLDLRSGAAKGKGLHLWFLNSNLSSGTWNKVENLCNKQADKLKRIENSNVYVYIDEIRIFLRNESVRLERYAQRKGRLADAKTLFIQSGFQAKQFFVGKL